MYFTACLNTGERGVAIFRSTGTNFARRNASPTMGISNSDFLPRIAIRRGIAPTMAGASALLV